MEKQYNDEIDLIEVFNNTLKSIYLFFNRWYKILGIITFVGLLLGIGISLLNKDKFHNNLLGTSPYIQPTLIVDIINSLNDVNLSDKKSFQKTLNISLKDAQNIKSFHADTIETLYKDILKYNSEKKEFEIIKEKIPTIKLELVYKNSIDVKEFTDKLVRYIDENEYVKRELNIVKRKSETLIKKTDYEISKLDSLQKNILKSSLKSNNSNGKSLLVMNEQINNFFNNDVIKLEKEKQNHLNKLAHLTGLEIISEFAPAKIKNRSTIETLAIFGSIAFGIGFFVLLGFEIRRKAIQLINKQLKEQK